MDSNPQSRRTQQEVKMTFTEELKQAYKGLAEVNKAVRLIETCMIESYISSKLRFKGLK